MQIPYTSRTQTVMSRLPSKPSDPTPIKVVTFEEVKTIISKTKKKGPGPDITNLALKNLPKKAVSAITGIINAIFRFKHFPSRWKSANVIVLHKPEKTKNFSQNYRPISFFLFIGKLAERAMRVRLN